MDMRPVKLPSSSKKLAFAKVTIKGGFQLDQLRYERAFPLTKQDADNIFMSYRLDREYDIFIWTHDDWSAPKRWMSNHKFEELAPSEVIGLGYSLPEIGRVTWQHFAKVRTVDLNNGAPDFPMTLFSSLHCCPYSENECNRLEDYLRCKSALIWGPPRIPLEVTLTRFNSTNTCNWNVSQWQEWGWEVQSGNLATV